MYKRLGVLEFSSRRSYHRPTPLDFHILSFLAIFIYINAKILSSKPILYNLAEIQCICKMDFGKVL